MELHHQRQPRRASIQPRRPSEMASLVDRSFPSRTEPTTTGNRMPAMRWTAAARASALAGRTRPTPAIYALVSRPSLGSVIEVQLTSLDVAHPAPQSAKPTFDERQARPCVGRAWRTSAPQLVGKVPITVPHLVRAARAPPHAATRELLYRGSDMDLNDDHAWRRRQGGLDGREKT